MSITDDIQTLQQAAKVLGRNGKPAEADTCIAVASTLAVDLALGADPRPAPGKRLERLAPRPGRIGGPV